MSENAERNGDAAPYRRNRPNRLIHEVSPYLLQHAYNPVEWYAWGEDAFSRAAEDDKPVFLSIGYSTCHWCHVMERESFEDPEVAHLLNSLFVPVKVDREERPDLDSLYMAASQMLSGGGGWPLNVFLTPEKKPFFAMTYIPRERRFGNPGIIEILNGIGSMWKESRSELLKAAEGVTVSLRGTPRKGRRIQRNITDAGFEELLLRFDGKNGGFGNAPKFPLPHNLLFLLRYSLLKGEERSVQMTETTLRSMAMGGIYDHLGSGFHRYSTDPHWLVPHFEKMLYDQALLSMVYSEAYQASGDELFGTIAGECLDYVIREMTSPEGGFFSAEDADSDGEEGGYYLWTKKEIEELLDQETAKAVTAAWHLTTSGNFIDPVAGERIGKNILHFPRGLADLASRMGIPVEDLTATLVKARRILLTARKKRHPPLIDDKILADWNGLMIAAFAKAARVFDEARYREAALRAAGFILASMRDADGKLFHRYRNGQAGITGQAADYAYLIFGLTELYMATFDPAYLSAAIELERYLDTHFWDHANGGYFTASGIQTDLVARQKELYDGALPSANSVAFSNLIRLAMLTGDTSLEKRASDLARLYTGLLERSPAACTFFLSGLCLLFGPATEVVLVEGPGGKPVKDMTDALNRLYLPFMVVLLKNEVTEVSLAKTAPFTNKLGPVDGKTAAYVCSRNTCSVPVTGVKDLLESVKGGDAGTNPFRKKSDIS
jgi:uncharacterized protein YyaL (SSP411 family)